MHNHDMVGDLLLTSINACHSISVYVVGESGSKEEGMRRMGNLHVRV